MLELLHAVITSLLLSTAVGGNVDQATQADEEPANSETGVNVGKMPAHLTAPRGMAGNDQQDDHQPATPPEPVAFCEPSVWVDQPLDSIHGLPQAVPFRTSGRSP